MRIVFAFCADSVLLKNHIFFGIRCKLRNVEAPAVWTSSPFIGTEISPIKGVIKLFIKQIDTGAAVTVSQLQLPVYFSYTEMLSYYILLTVRVAIEIFLYRDTCGICSVCDYDVVDA